MSERKATLEEWIESHRRANVPVFCHTCNNHAKTEPAVGFLQAPGEPDSLGTPACKAHAHSFLEEMERRVPNEPTWVLVPIHEYLGRAAWRERR